MASRFNDFATIIGAVTAILSIIGVGKVYFTDSHLPKARITVLCDLIDDAERSESMRGRESELVQLSHRAREQHPSMSDKTRARWRYERLRIRSLDAQGRWSQWKAWASGLSGIINDDIMELSRLQVGAYYNQVGESLLTECDTLTNFDAIMSFRHPKSVKSCHVASGLMVNGLLIEYSDPFVDFSAMNTSHIWTIVASTHASRLLHSCVTTFPPLTRTIDPSQQGALTGAV
jgi:hypothetical protein